MNLLFSKLFHQQNFTSLVNKDVVNVIVENSGEFSVMTKFSLYLDENTELTSFETEKSKRNSNKMQEHVLKPTVFTGDFVCCINTNKKQYLLVNLFVILK